MGKQYWAIWSSSGMHIGTWDNYEVAYKIFVAEYPKGRLAQLVEADYVSQLENEIQQLIAESKMMSARRDSNYEALLEQLDHVNMTLTNSLKPFNDIQALLTQTGDSLRAMIKR